MDYDGPRTLSGFVAFINQQAGTSVQVSDADKAVDATAEDDGEDHYAHEHEHEEL